MFKVLIQHVHKTGSTYIAVVRIKKYGCNYNLKCI